MWHSDSSQYWRLLEVDFKPRLHSRRVLELVSFSEGFVKGLNVATGLSLRRLVVTTIVAGIVCSAGSEFLRDIEFNASDGEGHGPDFGTTEWDSVVSSKRHHWGLVWNMTVIVGAVVSLTGSMVLVNRNRKQHGNIGEGAQHAARE